MSTTTSTRPARIQSTPDGEARCAHHDTWGSVCDACFDRTPFLMESFSMFYVMTGAEWSEDDPIVDRTSRTAKRTDVKVRVSPATPDVQAIDLADLEAGDTLYGYTSTRKPIVVAEVIDLADGRGITTTDGRRLGLRDPRVSVVKGAK